MDPPEPVFGRLAAQELSQEARHQVFGRVRFAYIEFVVLMQQADAVQGRPDDLGVLTCAALALAQWPDGFGDLIEDGVHGLAECFALRLLWAGKKQAADMGLVCL